MKRFVKTILMYAGIGILMGQAASGVGRPEALRDAIEAGRADEAAGLIAQGADPRAKWKNDVTPLHLAAQTSEEVAAVLIANGADVNARHSDGVTPLMVAVHFGRVKTVKLLLAKGADAKAANQNGSAPLHVAAGRSMRMRGQVPDPKTCAEVAQILLDKGIAVDARDTKGITPLMVAVAANRRAVAEVLLAAGANINAADTSGRTVMGWISRTNIAGWRQFLTAKGAKPAGTVDPGRDAVWKLWKAIRKSDRKNLEQLLAAGVDPNACSAMTKRTALHELAYNQRNPDVDAARILIAHGANVNARDKTGATPLHHAARMGSEAYAELLIAAKADVNAQDSDGCTPLHRALGVSKSRVPHLLVTHGADLNIKSKSGMTPLKLADRLPGMGRMLQKLKAGKPQPAWVRAVGHPGEYSKLSKAQATQMLAEAVQGSGDMALSRVRALLAAGADVRAKDSRGGQPLYWAMRSDTTDIAKALLDVGADVNATGPEGQTPLFLAVAKKNRQGRVQLLLSKGAKVNVRNSKGQTPLHLAAGGGEWSFGSNRKDRTGNLLLAAGADVNARDKQGRTPLHLAAMNNNYTAIFPLLDKGADLNAKDTAGSTPLHLARSNSTAAKLLKNRRAKDEGPKVVPRAGGASGHLSRVEKHLAECRSIDVRDVDSRGNTLLHRQAMYHTYPQEGIEILLDRGADVNARNQNGVTPLFLATSRRNRRLAELLLSKGADPNASGRSGTTPLHLAAKHDTSEICRMLLAKGAKVNTANADDRRPLHLAAGEGSKLNVELLLANGADLHAADKQGCTALFLAASTRRVYRGQHMITRGDMVKLLIARGAKVTATDVQGKTPLHHAAKDRSAQSAEALLDWGADINASDEDGCTPLHAAVGELNDVMIKLLLARGANTTLKDKKGRTAKDIAAKRSSHLGRLFQQHQETSPRK